MKYIYQGKVENIAKKWRFSDGKTTGNFHEMPTSVHVAEGWLPITVINNETYDPEIQTRTGPVITEFADHAQLDYTVTDKGLAEVKTAKHNKVRSEGVEILLNKHDKDKRDLGYSTAAEDTLMDTDNTTLKDYYTNTIKPLINNSTTVQEVKNISYTWPTI